VQAEYRFCQKCGAPLKQQAGDFVPAPSDGDHIQKIPDLQAVDTRARRRMLFG
jgi:hypothetical protein